MRTSVTIRDVVIGEGIPKICVPVTGRTDKVIEDQAKEIAKVSPDLVEWRADYYEQVENWEAVEKILSMLRRILGPTPLLFTFRTSKEGGERSISEDDYVRLNRSVAKTGLADGVDVELYFDKNRSKALICELQALNCIVVCSNHHFEGTPKKETLFDIFCQMNETGADLLKIAVMPRDASDVLELLSASCKAGDQLDHPIISMAMSGIGSISRISGEIFGSSVTFAAVKETSAPGQLPIKELKKALDVIHHAL